MSRIALGLLGVGLVANVVHMGREWEEGELKEKRLVSVIPLPYAFRDLMGDWIGVAD